MWTFTGTWTHTKHSSSYVDEELEPDRQDRCELKVWDPQDLVMLSLLLH